MSEIARWMVAMLRLLRAMQPPNTNFVLIVMEGGSNVSRVVSDMDMENAERLIQAHQNKPDRAEFM